MVKWFHNEGTSLIEWAHIRQSCVSQMADFMNRSIFFCLFYLVQQESPVESDIGNIDRLQFENCFREGRRFGF